MSDEPVEPVGPSSPAPGDPRVDAALRRTAELAGTSPAEHVEIYEDVHRRLQEVLADASGRPAADVTGSSEPAEPPVEPAEPLVEPAEPGDAVR